MDAELPDKTDTINNLPANGSFTTSENIPKLRSKQDGKAVICQKCDPFTGVFNPTLQGILEIILYLRLGWVTGDAGLFGAWLFILLDFASTGCTGFAKSSIKTNIRIEAEKEPPPLFQSWGGLNCAVCIICGDGF